MSNKRCLVVGLGEFGKTLAIELAKLNMEIVAVDVTDRRVAAVRDAVASAVTADIRDPDAVAELCSGTFDFAILTMSGSLEASILGIIHLKQHRVEEIWAEANDGSRAEVMRRVGATRVFSPERDFARRFAQRLARQDLAEFIPIAEGFGVVEMEAPVWMHGKTLVQLELRNTYDVAVISVTTADGDVTVVPNPGREIVEGDTLVLVGSDANLARIREK